jgi:hypothetical protein
MEAATDALIVADWLQTRQIAANPDRYYERNPLLGSQPSEERVNFSIGGALLANTILHRFLPEKCLRYYQVGIMSIEFWAVSGNYSLGINARF